MFKVIGGLLGRWLGGGTLAALIAMGGGWLWHDWQTGRLESRLAEARGESTELRALLSEWQAAAERRGQELERAQEEAEAARVAVDRLEGQLETQETAYHQLRQQILSAPESQDGPVAPVLRNTLEALP